MNFTFGSNIMPTPHGWEKKFMPIYECKNPPTIEGKVHKNPPIIDGRVHKNPPIHTPHDLCRFGS
jgi:hypothetical protein